MRALFLAAISAALLATGPVLAASPAEGLWAMPQGGVRVQISACGKALCGRLVSANSLKRNPRLKDVKNSNSALRGRPVKNLLIMQGFSGDAPSWSGGTVYNPDDGRTYHGSMKLTDPRTLKVTGCVVKPLCKSQTLKRVS